jgi:hypothetical protein
MKKPSKKKKQGNDDDLLPVNLNPDDSLFPVVDDKDEKPEIYKISKRGLSINRKDFIKAASGLAGLAALGSLLQSCEESELDIEKSGKNCTCHVVCTCNTDPGDSEDNHEIGNNMESWYDSRQVCQCDTVCTCNTVCTCDTVCSCNSDSGGGGGGGSYYYTYSYWYPN